MRTSRAWAVRVAVVGLLGTACASTGEPAQTSAVDVVRVAADGVSQTVVPAADGFSHVTVTTATYGEDGGVDGVLQLQVSGAGTERLTAAGAADLGDNAPVTLGFAPIEDSAGETFTLTFSYAGTRPLALYANPYDPYPDGDLVDRDGDLVFVLGHADRVRGTLDALRRVAGETSDRATSDPAFLVVWLLLVAGAGALVVRTRRVDDHPAPDAGRDGRRPSRTSGR